MHASPDTPRKVIASNKKARRDYHVQERLEVGIALRGTEVKSVREGHVSFAGAYAAVENGEVFLYHLNISPYEFGNRFNHEPARERRLLLHRREIRRLKQQTDERGCALVPLGIYLKRGRVKVELGVCKGKRQTDKRETLRRRTLDREAARAMSRH